MVLVNEIVDAVEHFMKGIPLNEESLALELMHKVGPAGNYVQEAHTLDHFREIRYSEVFDRTNLAGWTKKGEKRFEQRLQELTLEKMKHRPAPLPADVVRELDSMQASWK
jgi:trimethylamine--corrinoid protein Co-methyltransferase